MRPMTTETAELEYQLISSDSGRSLLAEIALVDSPAPADFLRWRQRSAPEVVSAAVRIAQTRKKGLAKFSKADRMWFEPTALEQSTSEEVATHKAKRFAGSPVVDICCGIGGDTIALAKASSVISVDRDAGMLRRAIWNAEVYGVRENVQEVACDVEDLGIPEGRLLHIDPDRRFNSASRARRVADYSPSLDWLRSITTSQRGGAVKLGPASDVFEQFGRHGFEIEVISLHGECKEATVWFGELVTSRRRATVLPSGATWTGGANSTAQAPISVLREYLFEPDAALVRSGLLDSFAIEHGLSRFSHGLDLLTGRESLSSPFLVQFRVSQELPLDNRILRSEFRSRRWTPTEVKSRGLAPEAVAKLVRGTQLADRHRVTLFLLNSVDKSLAILATRSK